MNADSSSPALTLEAKGLRKFFSVRRGWAQRKTGWIRAVDGVDVAIPAGKTLGLVGESGCGKSTVARLVLKLLPADRGVIRFQDEDISTLSEWRMKPLRRKMQIVFQDPFGSLNPRMTARQCVAEGLRTLNFPRRKRTARVAELLEMVGLPPESANRFPHEFSGGQRQRIGIARALSVEPALIVCDEPVSALDVSIQAQVLNLLRDLQEKLGLSYLFISHDLNVVGYLSDWIAVMYLGQVMEIAPAADLLDQPRHPYTQALLAAVPDLNARPGQMPASLPGDPATPLDPPPGCRFQSRCPLVEERCRQGVIEDMIVGENHRARCWKIG